MGVVILSMFSLIFKIVIIVKEGCIKMIPILRRMYRILVIIG